MKFKRNLSLLAACSFLSIASSTLWADECLEPLLNKVNLQFHAEEWVTTKTALVNMSVNAAVADKAIETIQSNVLNKLNSFSNKADWHIVAFNRQQDKSGLESIQITAQARLMQTDLAGLRDKAKAISKPGETFSLDDVQFIPSEDEIRQGNNLLRNNIYQQIKAEIDVLNRLYPDQKFYLHQVDFVSTQVPMPMMAMNAMVMGKSMSPRAPSALSVGNKQELTATVILASMPNPITAKLAHN